jgi:transposase
MRSVALDVGVRQIALCEVKDGQVIERATVRSVLALERYLGPNTPKAQVAIEASREAWALHDRLQQWGHETVMVDTTRVRQLGVGQHGRKTDRIDAQTLALALERGHIPKAHVLSPHRRQLRLHLQVRRGLVETRAQYITTIRGLVRASGESLDSCRSANFLELLQQTPLKESTRALVEPLAQILEKLNEQIALTEAKLLELCAQESAIERLTTVPGISLITAAAFVSVIDDAGRFRYAHQVESYLGLVPSENSSGGKRRVGSITKQGNTYLRALLVQASWSLLRGCPEDPLVKWALHLASRRGKRVAVVALARRLSGLLWAMWRDQTVYEPGRVGMQSARGLERQAQSVKFQAEAMARAACKVRHRYRPMPAE